MWTDEKVRALKIFWRSNWSATAAALALDMTRNAIIGKVNRLRARGDADIQAGDLTRELMRRAGGDKIGAEAAMGVIARAKGDLERLSLSARTTAARHP